MHAPRAHTPEHLAFHAVATALEGDLAKLRTLKSRHRTWEAVRDALPIALRTHARGHPAGEALAPANIGLVLPEDPDFPALLREIPLPPLGLYIRGALPPASQPTLAIVGTRRATKEGKRFAHELARELGATCSIASGLAFGIDAAAHAGCLEGGGHTVAVLAGGVDAPQPQLNAGLAARILEGGGALVSEYPPGSVPVPYRFLERNRIVSGLSHGVVLIEAPEGSGALVTARCALEQNREVFVVPGPVAHPNFQGAHTLIREGARLVRSAADIREDLGLAAPQQLIPATGAATASPEEHAVLVALRGAARPLSVDMLISATSLEARAVNRALSFLLLKNMVQETGEGYILRA
jgi:DNA processing protein